MYCSFSPLLLWGIPLHALSVACGSPAPPAHAALHPYVSRTRAVFGTSSASPSSDALMRRWLPPQPGGSYCPFHAPVGGVLQSPDEAWLAQSSSLPAGAGSIAQRSEEHTSELQSREL